MASTTTTTTTAPPPATPAHPQAAELAKHGIQILAPVEAVIAERVLTVPALLFLAELQRRYDPVRRELLEQRAARQKRLDAGEFPTFLAETRAVREGQWRCAAPPADMRDRRVEITGPVSRKMVINALNSGAKVFMADFEDANSPLWSNNVHGQLNLQDAVRRTIAVRDDKTGKQYQLNAAGLAVLMVRPRGWHLEEAHVLVDGAAVSASLFDFALFAYHNAAELVARGSGPYFYLPKMEGHREARLWNAVFVEAQRLLGLREGTMRATVLIETILAAFEMDEILYELRQHSLGLNCGRWDYLFSVMKKFIAHAAFVMGDREKITMVQPFMAAYVALLIRTCHRRGVHAMGGMAAQIPVAGDAAANQAALAKVAADKTREVTAGHDGTWVAHPALIATSLAAFDAVLKGRVNQLDAAPRDDAAATTPQQLIAVPRDIVVSEAGLRGNLRVSLLYLEAWLRGNGAVGIANLMEDLATAEIARSQISQWIRHQARIGGSQAQPGAGAVITRDLAQQLLRDELALLVAAKKSPAEKVALDNAAAILDKMLSAPTFSEFMSLEAYAYLLTPQAAAAAAARATRARL